MGWQPLQRQASSRGRSAESDCQLRHCSLGTEVVKRVPELWESAGFADLQPPELEGFGLLDFLQELAGEGAKRLSDWSNCPSRGSPWRFHRLGPALKRVDTPTAMRSPTATSISACLAGVGALTLEQSGKLAHVGRASHFRL